MGAQSKESAVRRAHRKLILKTDTRGDLDEKMKVLSVERSHKATWAPGNWRFFFCFFVFLFTCLYSGPEDSHTSWEGLDPTIQKYR